MGIFEIMSIRFLLTACALSILSYVVAFEVPLARADQVLVSGQMTAKKKSHQSSQQEISLLRSQLRTAKGRLPTIPFDAKSFDRFSSSSPRLDEAPSVKGSEKIAPQASGLGRIVWPYSTARVANSSTQPLSGMIDTPVTGLPYRVTGKLYAEFDGVWYVCTAALIKKSILITAAHCVHNYGQGDAGYADRVLWAPANTGDETNPGYWGFYEGEGWLVPTPYYNGTDTCTYTGVTCNNDIATVSLYPINGQYAGNALGGWYSYSSGGYSFARSRTFGNSTVASITQLGYPADFDSGYQMQRNDSFGKYVSARAKNRKRLFNIELGSAMTQGSSGGPWLVNFGTAPSLTGSATMGNSAISNVVVGVTSWGYGGGANVMGSSWFGKNSEYPLNDYGGYGAGNIGSLMYSTCSNYPSSC